MGENKAKTEYTVIQVSRLTGISTQSIYKYKNYRKFFYKNASGVLVCSAKDIETLLFIKDLWRGGGENE